jgi:hypothetical protein
MDLKLTIALIGVTVTAIGWLVVYYLDRSREDRRRQLEKRLEYATRQIEEFYGPLFNLAHQIFLANHVQEKILSASNESGKRKLTEDQAHSVQSFFQQQHFCALHDEINSILKHKLHLVRGTQMPRSFYDYLLHALQERDQRELWEQMKIDTSFVPGFGWPTKFYNDLKEGLSAAMVDYEHALAGLQRK